jgi:outer membrane protein TolC
VVPLREIIRDEALLTYNGMITNTFELLADTRARTNAMLQAAQARRNYWLAEANAVAVVHGGGADSGITRTAVASGGAESPAH